MRLQFARSSGMTVSLLGLRLAMLAIVMCRREQNILVCIVIEQLGVFTLKSHKVALLDREWTAMHSSSNVYGKGSRCLPWAQHT